ncbi:MAG: DNA polymerase III subunit epsilon [Alphaproteobacteria bacterium]|nr:MAG: DNA polymerase III subunit epsilon [Alphaproteobacteria bacterium]
MREIVFDTETTGLDPYQGDRLVEIGCVELVNGFPTGQTFHAYINPERDVPDAAFQVHGLSAEFLKGKPVFADICEEFLAFVADAPLVAHNAMFDLGFINAELERCKKVLLQRDRLVDTLMLARRRYPGAPASLDQLCARFSVDTSRRTKHGALLDAELLAEVYVELTGKRQARLSLVEEPISISHQGVITVVRMRPTPLLPRITDTERAAHRAFVATLGDKAVWNEYLAAG